MFTNHGAGNGRNRAETVLVLEIASILNLNVSFDRLLNDLRKFFFGVVFMVVWWKLFEYSIFLSNIARIFENGHFSNIRTITSLNNHMII